MARRDLIAALDIGSSKICWFIDRLDGHGRVKVAGIGHQASNGVKAGAIIDMDAAEESIKTAVHTAERMPARPCATWWSVSPAASRRAA